MKIISMTLIFQLIIQSLYAQAWTSLSDVPENLTFPVAVVLNGNIHLIGGGGPNGATDLHLRYTISTDKWDTLAPVPYLAQQPGGAEAGGKIYYFGGGFPNSGTPLNDHFVYDPVTDSWDTAADIPANRVIHEAVTLKDSIYVMGGQPDKLRFELYSTSSNSWKKLNNLTDQNFWYGAIVNVKDNLYRFGGGGYLGPQKTSQRYNIQNDNWANLSGLPEVLHAPAAAVIGDSVYIVGGYTTTGETDKVWIYDVNTQTYHAGFALPEPRYYHALLSVGTCIYAIGGQNLNVDKSIIRHCVGDTADYTGVKAIEAESNDMDLKYSRGVLDIQLNNRLPSNHASIEVFDLSGQLLFHKTAILNEVGFASIELNPAMSAHKTQVCIIKVLYGEESKTIKIFNRL